ncbi:hypothetical protein CSOJ01_03742 [Colletotrichum sojae]|uniref:Uncharacterized protein n=1 Tax=Colletotrichum sojae TaxID=2175907 RepID=A0A8H6N0N6_9PEZI|nr:hypothetical protein CSOJ01_03742 [Colletotrichum sojae]
MAWCAADPTAATSSSLPNDQLMFRPCLSLPAGCTLPVGWDVNVTNSGDPAAGIATSNQSAARHVTLPQGSSSSSRLQQQQHRDDAKAASEHTDRASRCASASQFFRGFSRRPGRRSQVSTAAENPEQELPSLVYSLLR